MSLAGCGQSGSQPIAPREARFVVTAESGTPFQVNEFLATNGPPHTFTPAASCPPPSGTPDDPTDNCFIAPYAFIFLNAGKPPGQAPAAPIEPAVSGAFQGASAAVDVRIDLFVARSSNPLESLVATAVIPKQSTDATVLVTPDRTPMPDPPPPAAHEYRTDVVDFDDPTFVGQQFSALLGDETASFQACGDTGVCASPTTFYFENPQEFFNVVIRKLVLDSRKLLIRVYVDGVLAGQAVASATDNSTVHLNL